MYPYYYFRYPKPGYYPQPQNGWNYPQAYQPYCHPVHFCRTFPAIDPQMFMSSAKKMEVLMRDASTLLVNMAESKKFSYELMSAAQQSNKDAVEKMIKSTGISRIPSVSYTPDGLSLHFESDKEDPQKCCDLTLKLRWM
ncbi:hypothetical protein AF332_06440 [Sporosarcina globispora]|uniref:Inner spore coat protein n=1 Tax=Sporosarcina globispora TaxID=1459 RepID=A0A0M0G9K2_SPOGL|nr:hypothetical protein [Sporosarcina globispora]KON86499.1 hypothetical protein AF332_06440 [Sporosarcina globispora]